MDKDRKQIQIKQQAGVLFWVLTKQLVKFTHTCNVGTRLRIKVIAQEPPAIESSNSSTHSTYMTRKATPRWWLMHADAQVVVGRDRY